MRVTYMNASTRQTLTKRQTLAEPSRETQAVEVSETPKAAIMPKIEVAGLNFYYGTRQALYGISLGVPEKKITALCKKNGHNSVARAHAEPHARNGAAHPCGGRSPA